MAAGELDLLILQIPIQHAKTTYASVYNAAYTLGNWPNKYIVAVSYNDQIAADRIGRPAQKVMERCGVPVFDVSIDPRSNSASRWDILGHNGGLITTSISSGVAGRPIDRLITDDPVGSRVDIDSRQKRDRMWQKYSEEFRGRIAPGGGEIMIMSRWDTDDLVGRAMRDAIERELRFDVIDLPGLCPPVDSESMLSEVRRAIARDNNVPQPAPEPYVDVLGRKPGEALWPEVRPVPYLIKTRGTMGPRQFNAQIQMRPNEETGSFFKRAWFSYYEVHGAELVYDDVLGEGLYVARTVPIAKLLRNQYFDLALSERQTADFFVAMTVGVAPADKTIFVLDIFRARIPGPAQLPQLWKSYNAWRPKKQKIEAVAYQGALVQSAIADGLPAFPIKRGREDKATRATYAATRLEQRRIFFPRRASWLAEFEDELLKFPGGKDDQVDTLADAANDLLDPDLFADDGNLAGGYVE